MRLILALLVFYRCSKHFKMCIQGWRPLADRPWSDYLLYHLIHSPLSLCAPTTAPWTLSPISSPNSTLKRTHTPAFTSLSFPPWSLKGLILGAQSQSLMLNHGLHNPLACHVNQMRVKAFLSTWQVSVADLSPRHVGPVVFRALK